MELLKSNLSLEFEFQSLPKNKSSSVLLKTRDQKGGLFIDMSSFLEKPTLLAIGAFETAPADPTLDLNMQLTKLGNGLLTGKYSIPAREREATINASTPTSSTKQEGIPPRMFKTVIAASHPEFSSMRQQDALEFFMHLLYQVERANAGNAQLDPSTRFKFVIEERLLCPTGKVSYNKRVDTILSLNIPFHEATIKEQLEALHKLKLKKSLEGKDISSDESVRHRVPLEACLANFSAPEEVHEFYSSALNVKTTAIKPTGLTSFPDYLVLHMRKFIMEEGWVPKKLDISHMRSKGLQPGEELLPEGGGCEKVESRKPSANEDIVSHLANMGFNNLHCTKAAINTLNAGVEEAMNWLLSHMEAPDIDDPISEDTQSVEAVSPKVDTLVSLGFQEETAIKAFGASRSEVWSFLAFGKDFVDWNYKKTGNPVYLHIKQSKKQVPEDRPLEKQTLLAIGVDGGFDNHEPEYEEIYNHDPDFVSLPFPSVEVPEKLETITADLEGAAMPKLWGGDAVLRQVPHVNIKLTSIWLVFIVLSAAVIMDTPWKTLVEQNVKNGGDIFNKDRPVPKISTKVSEKLKPPQNGYYVLALTCPRSFLLYRGHLNHLGGAPPRIMVHGLWPPPGWQKMFRPFDPTLNGNQPLLNLAHSHWRKLTPRGVHSTLDQGQRNIQFWASEWTKHGVKLTLTSELYVKLAIDLFLRINRRIDAVVEELHTSHFDADIGWTAVIEPADLLSEISDIIQAKARLICNRNEMWPEKEFLTGIYINVSSQYPYKFENMQDVGSCIGLSIIHP